MVLRRRTDRTTTSTWSAGRPAATRRRPARRWSGPGRGCGGWSRPAWPAGSSAARAAHLLGKETSPTRAAVRAERLVRLQEALNSLDPLDREVLSLRHFEELSHAEAARVLEIGEAAAAKRYIRALKRLKD